jgi:hypothetical protein
MKDLWDTIKRPNLWVMGREEVQAERIENILNRVIWDNVPNLEKETAIQIQEAFRTSKIQDQKRITTRHRIAKTVSVQNKERKLKSVREKE